jgi:hypothetical protein
MNKEDKRTIVLLRNEFDKGYKKAREEELEFLKLLKIDMVEDELEEYYDRIVERIEELKK